MDELSRVSAAGDLSTLVVSLLKGVLYRDDDPALWSALLDLQARVRDHVAVLGPTFGEYARAARAVGARVQDVRRLADLPTARMLLDWRDALSMKHWFTRRVAGSSGVYSLSTN